MINYPSGTVTFLFTDIEGNTNLDDAEFNRLLAEGRTMTVEQGVALALEK